MFYLPHTSKYQRCKFVSLCECVSFTTHFHTHGTKRIGFVSHFFYQKRVFDKKTLENDIFFQYFDDLCRGVQFLFGLWKQKLVYKLNIYHINFCIKDLKWLLNELISLNHSHFHDMLTKTLRKFQFWCFLK